MIQLARQAMAALAALGIIALAPAHTLKSVADLPPQARPADVPADYVITPMGYFHPSCVARVKQGETIAASGDLLAPNGQFRKVPACLHDRFDPRGQRRGGPVARPQETFDGWLAYSSANPSNSPPAQVMSARWVVPAAPQANDGQVLYFFPGLETSPNSDSILQPVLAWNGYGDSAWTMTGWNCCIQGTVYNGQSIPVSTGDEILGDMIGSSCASDGICSSWQIVSSDLTTGQSTTFSTSPYGQAFNWYFGGVMEVYGVGDCTDFPASGGIDFDRLLLTGLTSNVVTPAWVTSVTPGAPPCGFAVDTSATTTRIRFSPN